ncbi:sugar ABC transporter substrate-binding protein [Kitasatospora sp. NE20-6]|uniref:extracellular solute-binding protein n=1 Tax=Kitasatospora sp. NE20-6 TaxID=2859066 RepID=UPI0034DB7E6C
MKRQLTAAIGLAALVAGAVGCSSGGTAGQDAAASAAAETGTVTVWLMGEAQTTWPELVQQVNDEFAAKYPKAELHLRYQTWKDKVGNLDEALKANSAPDVVELGNTETMKYILNGSLAPVDRSSYDNNETWIRGLVDTCTYQDKLFCVPYYAGARVALYNSAMFKEATGSEAVPATEDELLSALDRVQSDKRGQKSFSALYLPGPYWYAAMSYVAAYGGSIARFDDTGRWHGTLSEPKSRQGVTHFIGLVKKYNHGDLKADELDQAAVLGKHRTAMLYGNGWEVAGALEPLSGDPKLKDVLRVTTMPGPNGKPLPSFIGGSDLAVTAGSKVQDLAKDWVRMFTSAKSQQVLADKDTLPNNLTQLAPLKSKPATAAAANAVPDAWFTPVAPGWAAIEKQKVLVEMLDDILAGASVEAATTAADARIDQLINNPS